jgi:tricarballylate dehydrogenase
MSEARDVDCIVVGCGIAGLTASVAAAERGARVLVIERAGFDERGGNTRYTEAFLRMKSETEVADDFEDHFAANAGGHLDPALVAMTAGPRQSWPSILRSLGFADPELVTTFAREVPPTIAWLKGLGVRFDFLPVPFLTKSAPKMMPVGGGLALIEVLASRAEALGVEFRYETTATDLILDDRGAVAGLRVIARSAGRSELRGGAVVLACGGFEGNPEMLAQYLGPQSVYLRPVARGGHFNKGEGIRMALRIGAAQCGEYGNYHAEPVDPRSGMAEASVFIFPYGIIVNRQGRRFTDEAPGPVDATYEGISRQIPGQPGGIAFAILDGKVDEIENWRVAVRSDQPAVEAGDVAGLAARLGLPPQPLIATIDAYNRACRPGRFAPRELDGLATVGLDPPKSNWARPLDRAPYRAFPMISANVFTFGGLKINGDAQVIDNDGEAIPNLYAAGEVVGLYYGAYTGATSVLKGATFGRLAGEHVARVRPVVVA